MITNLLNDVFNTEQIEMNKITKRYFKILIIIIILLMVLLFVQKNRYYMNSLIIGEDSILLVVDKKMVNEIINKNSLLINDISSNYSINKIIPDGDICYIDINLETNILNDRERKYKIFLGKEKMVEYFIRIIKMI